MYRVLGGLQWSSCLVYFDDVIVVGRTFDDHLRHTGGVLMQLREAGLKLKPAKCNLCQQQESFLGHIVPTRGISTYPSKTEMIAKCKDIFLYSLASPFSTDSSLVVYLKTFLLNVIPVTPTQLHVHCRNAISHSFQLTLQVNMHYHTQICPHHTHAHIHTYTQTHIHTDWASTTCSDFGFLLFSQSIHVHCT